MEQSRRDGEQHEFYESWTMSMTLWPPVHPRHGAGLVLQRGSQMPSDSFSVGFASKLWPCPPQFHPLYKIVFFLSCFLCQFFSLPHPSFLFKTNMYIYVYVYIYTHTLILLVVSVDFGWAIVKSQQVTLWNKGLQHTYYLS